MQVNSMKNLKINHTLAAATVWAVDKVPQRLTVPGSWYIARQKETLSIISLSSYGAVIDVDLPPVDSTKIEEVE